MILYTTLELLRQRLNEHLQNSNRRSDDWVVLSSLVELDGTPFSGAQNRIVMSVVNILRETSTVGTAGRRHTGDSWLVRSAPIYIDVDLSFIANFSPKAYGDGLAALSLVISFFQQNSVITQAGTPELPDQLDKLTIEFLDQSQTDLNQIMTNLGSKYLPAVFYRLRMLPYGADDIQKRGFAVQSVGLDPAKPES